MDSLKYYILLMACFAPLLDSTVMAQNQSQEAFVEELFKSQSKSSDCKSANCEAYAEEVQRFKEKLRSIGCYKDKLDLTNCNQIEFQNETRKFQEKINADFHAPNVASAIKNDIQFNSVQNRFTSKSQNAPDVYELIKVLDDVNIGVHAGKVVNNQIFADREIKIDPSGKDPANSAWSLTQWKKEQPLMLNRTRQDPIITNSRYVDQYLGSPKFEINSPTDPKYGVETSLLIYKDPVDNSNVFEIVSRNGYLNDVGGSNVFLSSTLSNQEYSSFSNDINLTFNGKISRLKAQKFPIANPDDPVIASVFTGFTAYYSPPNGGPGTNLFIQINHADSRNNNFVHSGCYMHGENVEIVSALNVSDDFTGKAAPTNSPLVPKKYNLNEYLCRSLKLKYNCPAQYKGVPISSTDTDLSRWTFTGFYTGLETQVAKGKGQDGLNIGPVLGEVEAGIQYSNMRVTANTKTKYKSCEDVLNRPVDVPNCERGTFQDAKGRNVEFSCGCGEVAGAVKQENGCYHLVSSEAGPKPETENSQCRKGTFKNAQGKNFEFLCGCGEISGAVKQDDGCYHREATTSSASEKNECRTGFFTNELGKEIEFSCGCGDLLAGTLQADGCFHRPSLR